MMDSNSLPNPSAFAAAESREPMAVPEGMTRREYWQKISERAHAVENPAAVDGLETPEEAGPVRPAPGRLQLRLRWPHPKFGPPFWTITGILSLIVNVVLIVVLYSLAQQIFGIKNALNQQLIAGLSDNFAMMDQAHIRTTIPINTSVPAKFNVPLNTQTVVKLQKDVLLRRARVLNLTTGTLTISSAPADIVLPAGTELPVSLNLTVPIDQQIPVNLTVDVDIPLNQTDLHRPFVGLQNVVAPYYQLLSNTPNTLQQAVCGKDGSDLCKSIIP